jgi:ribosomal protein S25
MLSNLALLDTFHAKKRDILEALVPFVEYALYTLKKEYMDASEVRETIATKCNVRMPLATMRSVLKKLHRLGVIQQFEGYEKIKYTPTSTEHVEQYKDALQTAEREINAVLEAYKRANNLKDVDNRSIASLFSDFISFSLRHADILDSEDHPPALRDTRFVSVSDFVVHIRKQDEKLFKAFKSIFFGTVLSNVVAGKGTIKEKRKLPAVRVFLESSFLFRILGLQSPDINEAAIELLDLMRKYDMPLVVLPDTVTEMRNSLVGIVQMLSTGAMPASVSEKEAEATDGILGAIYRRKMSLLELERYIAELENTLATLGIGILGGSPLKKIEVPPERYKRYFDVRLRKSLSRITLDSSDYDLDLLKEHFAGKLDDVNEAISKRLKDNIDAKVNQHLRIIEYIRKMRKHCCYDFVHCEHVVLTPVLHKFRT